jgi:ATP phosphoribosyltransferase regulatory subunit
MRSFEYYTGIVVEAYAPGVGLPLGGGGRYDRLLAAYDAPGPAAGFAVGLERVMIALVEQGVSVPVRELDAMVGGDQAAAFDVARVLRKAGWTVGLSRRSGVELVREAHDRGVVETLQASADCGAVRLDEAGRPTLPLENPVPCPPSSAKAGCSSAERATGGES